MQPAEAMEKAAELVQKHGKAEMVYEVNSGQLCSVGALRKALWGKVDAWGSTGIHEKKYEACLKALANSMSDQFGACCNARDYRDAYHIVTCINDHRATQDEVIACMQKAAESLRGG